MMSLRTHVPSSADSASRIQRVVSPGGIEAWLVEEYAVPVIAMDCAFAGGSAQDGAGRAGLGNMMRGLLDEGAGPHDAIQFQELLDEHAVEMGFQMGDDHMSASLRTLARNKEKAFDLFKLALTAPRFESSDVERVRAQIAAGIKQDAKKPDVLATQAWFRSAFDGHPYADPRRGDLETLARIDRDMIAAQAKALLARDNLKISVVGAIDAATLARVLDDVFGGLPAEAELKPVPKISPKKLGETQIIDLDVPQSTIVFGFEGLLRQDPDFIAATVMNHVLGGGSFTSRIWQEVREKRGLAYSVHLSLFPYRNAGLFYGSTATKNERAREALDVIRGEIERMAADGPTSDELEKAKKYLIGSYALRFDTSTKIAGNLTGIQVDDLGIDYVGRRNDLVAAVQREDAQRVAERLLKDGRMLVVAAGRPVDFGG